MSAWNQVCEANGSKASCNLEIERPRVAGRVKRARVAGDPLDYATTVDAMVKAAQAAQQGALAAAAHPGTPDAQAAAAAAKQAAAVSQGMLDAAMPKELHDVVAATVTAAAAAGAAAKSSAPSVVQAAQQAAQQTVAAVAAVPKAVQAGVQQGAETGFLESVRRYGPYALMAGGVTVLFGALVGGLAGSPRR